MFEQRFGPKFFYRLMSLVEKLETNRLNNSRSMR